MSTTVSPADAHESTTNEAAPDEGSKTERLRTYLRAQVREQGECFIKGKFIADEVGLTPKQIGQLMIQLQDDATDLEIEKWSYTSATTWRVAAPAPAST